MQVGTRVTHDNFGVICLGTISKVFPPRKGIPFPLYAVDWDGPINTKGVKIDSYSSELLTPLYFPKAD